MWEQFKTSFLTPARVVPVVMLAVQAGVTAATAWLHRLIAKGTVRGVTVIGPAPCPVERVKNRWRWHVLIKSDGPQDLGRVSRYLVERFPVPKQFGLRLTLDRDPVALL